MKGMMGDTEHIHILVEMFKKSERNMIQERGGEPKKHACCGRKY